MNRPGTDLAVAYLRRKEFLKTWAQHMEVSVTRLLRLEQEVDPQVSKDLARACPL